MKEINLFIEKLNIRVFLFKLIPFLVKNNKNKIQIFVIDFNRVAWKGLTFLELFFDFKKSIFNFKLIDVKDENNLLLRLRIAFKDIFDLQERIVSQPIYQTFLQSTPSHLRLFDYLKKTFANISIIFPDTIGRDMFLIQLALWKNKQINASAKCVLILGLNSWSEPLKRYANENQVEICIIKPFLPFPLVPYFISDILVGVMGLLKNRKDSFKDFPYFFQALKSLFIRNNISPETIPKVGIEYYGHLNPNRLELYSDVSSWQFSRSFKNHTKLFFGLPHSPYDENKKYEMDSVNLKAVVLRIDSSKLLDVPVYNLRQYIPRLQFSFKNLFSNEWQDLKNKEKTYFKAFQSWKKIFKDQGIKIYLTWYKYDQSHIAIADAIHVNDGICALYQRAYDAVASTEMTIFSDVFFGFSKNSALLEANCGSNITKYIVTGYLGDHRFELLKPMAQDIRSKLVKNGAKKIFCFFDEGSANDSRWHTGHELQRDGYEFCLNLIFDNPEFGVIFKPKIPKSLRARLGSVAELLKKAEETGRCIVLGVGELSNSYPPALAALASDFVIHSCVAATTAGLEAALAGKPTILIDREGWSISPMYRLGVGKVVFTEWKSVLKGIQNFYKGDKEFGNWDKFIAEFDPFRDGKASYRMAEFLDNVYDQFKAGFSKDESLSFAAQKYGEKWGFENVLKIENGKAISMKELDLVQSKK
ncbi:MAG: hypothetical protein ACKVQC_03220 [Elusimicrobiota bacterium]